MSLLSHMEADQPFLLFKVYPREHIHCSRSISIAEAGVDGLLSVERLMDCI